MKTKQSNRKGARRRASEAARKFLVGTLSEQLRRHDPELLGFGAHALGPPAHRVFWDEPNRRFYSSVHSLFGEEYRAELDLPFDLGEEARIGCTCQIGLHFKGCRHTVGLLRHVLGFLSTQKDDPILHEVLCLGTRPSWTRALSMLDHLLESHSSAPEPPVSKERRLTWRVGFTERGLSVGAWEQKISKATGQWTPGRRMSWRRVGLDPELLRFEADRRAIGTLRQYEYYDAEWYLDSFEALLALSGHPFVFWWDDPKKNVGVEEVELGLAVRETKDGLEIDGALGGRPLRGFSSEFLFVDPEGRGLVGFDTGEDRMLIAEADPGISRLVLDASRSAPKIPAEGQEELLSRLSQLEAMMPLTVPPDLIDAERQADPRIFLRLTPGEPSGLDAKLLVRPSGGSYFPPGEGPERLLGLESEQRIQIARQLEAESAAAREKVERLALGGHPETRPWQWWIENDEEALDLVLAAQEEVDRGLVVEWPEGESHRITSATPGALRIKIRDRHDWFGVEGAVEGEGWRLPLRTVLQALREGRRYVPVGDGSWAEIAQELRERLTALDDVVHERRKRLEIDVTAAPVLRELDVDSAAASTVKASRRFKELLRRLKNAEELTPDPPEALTAKLRGYQVEGYRWLRRLAEWGVGGCLADDMGLGKTVQTLAVLIDRSTDGPALVIAPTSVGFNWVREAERFAPTLSARLYRETDRDTVFQKLGPGDVVVASYGLVLRDADKLARVKWNTLVLDEAQAIKNSRTKTARAVRSLEADWCLALTGTPVENHLGELWSLFLAVSPGLFGSWDRFAERFAAPIEKQRDPERSEALSRLLRPFVLRRTKSEVLAELPERTEVQLSVELSPGERRLYESARQKILMELAQPTIEKPKGAQGGGGDDQRFQVLAALTRLRQLACHPALVNAEWTQPSSKLRLLLETVEELREGGHRALVFSQFTRHLGLVRAAFEKREIRYLYLDGQTSPRQRAERIDAFQNGEGDVFLISLKAGGTGLNLTGADYVVHLDPWWNPAVEDQATDRAHRIGQTRPVTVYRLVTRGTIEEEILSLHADKRGLVAGVLAGTDQAGKLSTSELVGLIRSGGEKSSRRR